MTDETLSKIVAECGDIDEFDRTPEQQAIVELAKIIDNHQEFLERF
jgi:hypothetical protein